MGKIPWFKVDDGFWSHPKVVELSSQAVALWVRAGSYSAQHLTGGVVTLPVVRMLGYQEDHADQLVEAGLWDGKADGKRPAYAFHDWEIYQPSSIATKEKRDEVSRKRAEAGRRGAEVRWSQDAKPEDGNADGKLLSVADGSVIAPSRPVPSSSSTKKSGAARRKPEVPLPADWSPNETHVRIARERGVDGRREEAQFRDHAAANDRRQRDWDAAFRTWLRNAKPQRATPGERANRTVMLATDLVREIEQ